MRTTDLFSRTGRNYTHFGTFLIYRFFIFAIGLSGFLSTSNAASHNNQPVYIIPIRENIEESIVYVVRRGVKEAMDQHAQALILDMNTNGGRGDAMEEIMEILESFKGETITYVNKKAYSAGAFIAVATKHIYMAPSSVIGAAAPIMMTPTGGAEDIPSTMKKKVSSAFSARIRAAAQRNGHNAAVVDAMVKETDGLNLDGKQIVQKGEILTLTDTEATSLYGKPPKPLLAEGIAQNMDEILTKFGFKDSQVHYIKPTGAERLAHFITTIAPFLLLIGIAGIYLEIKTPGVVLPGVIGVIALLIFFFGHYVAGLSGSEEILLFIFGLILIGVEIFILPGHVLPGFLGVVAIIVSLLWAMVNKIHPSPTSFPSFPDLQAPLAKLAGGISGAILLLWLLVRWLPKGGKGTYTGLILNTQLDKTKGYATSINHQELIGQQGIALSTLRPSGTARIGEKIVDVISEGDFIESNAEVVVTEVRGAQVTVRRVTK